jgi:hypothetical protein
MTTKKSKTKKVVARRKPAKKPLKKRSGSKAPQQMRECGDFDVYTEGDKLIMQIRSEIAFDASIVIEGNNCRSLMACRIVNGQWEC